MPEELFNKMWDIYKSLGADALVMNHYDLAEETEIDNPDLWRQFLTEPKVSDWIRTEINLIQDAELKKMIKGVNTSRSVGQAQLMNTLAKLNETRTTKEGPIFIYSYVPLDPQQDQAENIIKLDVDPFLKE